MNITSLSPSFFSCFFRVLQIKLNPKPFKQLAAVLDECYYFVIKQFKMWIFNGDLKILNHSSIYRHSIFASQIHSSQKSNKYKYKMYKLELICLLKFFGFAILNVHLTQQMDLILRVTHSHMRTNRFWARVRIHFVFECDTANVHHLSINIIS